jgi:cysteinyl-tRNA synthetase
MSLGLLGNVIDIHTGGIDLRFPHHEDERAQSNTVAGGEVVRQWVHAEHLLFAGRKMSKSAGNVVLVSDIAARNLDPLALRLIFLQHHYRQQMNLTWEGIAGAHTTLLRWRSKVADWSRSPSEAMPEDIVSSFLALVNEDLDTPSAMNVLFAAERDESIRAGAKFELFCYVDRVLGLDLARDVGRQNSIPAEVADLAEQRAEARSSRDWARADELREALTELGYAIVDESDGYRITPVNG